MELIKTIIYRLTKVKTIITMVALGLWIYVTLHGLVDGEFFKTVFTMIISVYFGTQITKKDDNDENTTAG